MTIRQILAAIQHSEWVRRITKSDHLVIAAFQIVHVFGILLLLSSMILVNLRLLGWVLPRESIPAIAREAAPLFWSGLALAVLSGALMFATGTEHYFYNPAFEAKMAMLAASIAVQLGLFRSVARRESPRPAVARVTVALSMALWFGVAIAGRAIGFV